MSGGMDSCVCAALAARDTEAAALHISYGQRTAERERWAFERICDHFGIKRRMAIRNETLGLIGGSALTDKDIDVPAAGEKIGADIPVTYVPFRNAHFLSAAVSWAEVLDAEKIYIGAVEQDSSGYPDCRPEYYRAFNAVIKSQRLVVRYGLKLAVSGCRWCLQVLDQRNPPHLGTVDPPR